MVETRGCLDEYLDNHHPEAACYLDLDRRLMTLNCGRQVPIVGVYDTDGEPLDESDMDLCTDMMVAFGPTPFSGYMLRVNVRQRKGDAGARHA